MFGHLYQGSVSLENMTLKIAFVYTGFKPQLLIIKKTGVAENWYTIDNKRNPHNPMQIYTVLNFQGVETTSSGDRDVDFLSNGFRIRSSRFSN